MNVFCLLNHRSESEVQQTCKTKDILLSISLTCFYPKSNFAQLVIKSFHNFIENSIYENIQYTIICILFRTDTLTIMSDCREVGGEKKQNKQNRKILKMVIKIMHVI